MESIVTTDSISIIVTNTWQYQRYFNNHYKNNEYLLIPVINKNNPDIKSFIVVHKSNTTQILFSINLSGNRFNSNIYTTFKFAGLKSYHQDNDTNMRNALIKLFKLLSTLDIEAKLTVNDSAFDFKANNKSIDNFLPIRIGQRTSIINPLEYYDTTLYVEDKSISKPSQKACLYIKQEKEKNLIENIIRFEISDRSLKKAENNYDSVIKHIENTISTYKLYYFNSKAKCNQIKRKYRDNIKVPKRENFPNSLEKKTKELGGREIKLSISTEIKSLIKMFFTKEKNLINYKRKIPAYIKNLPRRKRTKSLTQKKKISIYHIPEPKMLQSISSTKNSILTLTNKINSIPVNPLILKMFHYQNKAPPIKNLYLHPYSKYHYH